VENAEELGPKLEWALVQSPTHQVLVEESLIGWKEYELEVIRDSADNFIVICSIENLDPMGVHTGDSITVAPSMTLTDREYQRLRDAARGVMTEIGVETGGSNVQFAIDPKTGRVLVIEMNPRVSRSSALASKATGYPIAKIAAKLAVGFTLDELENDITGTSAAFEPTIDYVIVKWPRFAFEKFPGSDARLGTQMKSVGEAMAIGRTFPEALQKAARSLETGKAGLVSLFDRIDYRSLKFSPDAARNLSNDAPPLAKPSDLARQTLLEEDDDRASTEFLSWRHWLACHDQATLEPQRWLYLNFTYQQVQAALAGHGVALARVPLVFEALQRGELVEPFGVAGRIGSPFSYWMLVGPTSPMRNGCSKPKPRSRAT